MSGKVLDLVIVGAGQGGLSISYFMRKAGIDHVVLDRGGVAHAWETHRWDSFCLVTPNWTIGLPGGRYNGTDPDGFMPCDEFVRYMKDWAASFEAPVVVGVDVSRVMPERGHFILETSDGQLCARFVVIATATYQSPRIPSIASALPRGIKQFHAEDYKNCDQFPNGSVVVVGSGQTGCQIVEDLVRAGRETYLCVSRTGRLPRRYRGRDCLSWQQEMGLLDRTPDMLDSPAQRFQGDPHVTGRDGGATVNLYDFRRRGVTLLGRFEKVDGSVASFGDDLSRNLRYADDFAKDFMTRVDNYVGSAGLDAPSPSATELAAGPDLALDEIQSLPSLDLAESAVGAVVWATGFSFDFSWIDGLKTDDFLYPVTRCGKSSLPGLYFCGLNWMTKRKSGILYGVEEDAHAVAGDIIRRIAASPQTAILKDW